ncbi:MAG TPA: hypothetical protein VGM31_14255 [Puia sp.]|jgi:hypothetical protein
MAKYGLGLEKIELSDIAEDGGPGVAFTAIGNTVQGSAQLTQADGTTTDFNIEEQDDPVETVVSQKGKKTLAFSCFDVDGPTLVKFFGGTYTAYNATGPVHASYSPNDSASAIEKTVRLTDKKGNIFTIVRGNIAAKFNWSFTKDKLAQVDLTVDILVPTKEDTPSFSIQYPDPA